MNMLRRVEPYIAYGYPNLKSVRELIYKRGAGKVGADIIPLTDNQLVEARAAAAPSIPLPPLPPLPPHHPAHRQSACRRVRRRALDCCISSRASASCQDGVPAPRRTRASCCLVSFATIVNCCRLSTFSTVVATVEWRARAEMRTLSPDDRR